MTGDFNRIEQRLDSIEQRLEEGFSRPASLVLDEVLGLEQRTNERLDRLTEQVNQLAQMMGRILPAIEEMQTEVRGLQVENRRILDRLFGEQPG